jgi:hypothetical protein
MGASIMIQQPVAWLVALLLLVAPIRAIGQMTDRLLLPNGILVEAGDARFLLVDVARESAGILRTARTLDRLSGVPLPARNRQMLAGVFSAAWLSPPPGQAVPSKVPFSLQRYLHSLASSYVTTLATPQVMRRLAARLRSLGADESWVRFSDAMALDEDGHEDELVEDLKSLGLDAAAFLGAVQPPSAVVLVAYFNRLVDSDEPIAAIGYAYALQRSSLLLSREIVERIEALVPPGINATRTLRVHSAVGGNDKHARETEDFIATLPPAARRAVALALFETILLMRSQDDYPGDAVVDSLSARFTAKVPAGRGR